MQTTSTDFHSLRGHICDGCVIVAPSGKKFTLKHSLKGWIIYGPDNLPISGHLPYFYDVEYFVVNGLQNS